MDAIRRGEVTEPEIVVTIATVSSETNVNPPIIHGTTSDAFSFN